MRALTLSVAVVLTFFALWVHAYDREDYEEPAGSSFAILLNPDDVIYGMSFGDGTWLRGTPVFGDFFINMVHSDIEDSWYSGVGMTLRIMPHWRFVPFVGAGGSYNYSLSRGLEQDDLDMDQPDDALEDRGESYWGGHAEAGFRFWMANRVGLVELMGRYTWSSLGEDHEYWLAGISTGAGW